MRQRPDRREQIRRGNATLTQIVAQQLALLGGTAGPTVLARVTGTTAAAALLPLFGAVAALAQK